MTEPLKTLVAAPEHLNPAVVMHQKLAQEKPGIADLLLQKPEIDRAIKAGSEEVKEVMRAGRALIDSDAVPSGVVPDGF